MSIRLRLTLLYSAILALTLVAFSAMVYGIQSQSAFSSLERAMISGARRMVEMRQRQLSGEMPVHPPDRGPEPFPIMAPAPREITILQIRSVGGEVIFVVDEDEDVLPLSDAGLQAVQRGEAWFETADVDGERFLVLSEPVAVGGSVVEVLQSGRSLADQDRYLAALRSILGLGSGVAVVAAFGIGWVLAGLTLRPIHRITQTAQAIGAERDLSCRVDHTGPHDEIGRLASTFNTMLTELQAAYQLQQQFVADVSHELRTPLTTLRGNLALLRREPPISTSDQAEVLADMADESERLIRLVDGLLTLARADARRSLRSERVPVRPLVEDVCRQAGFIDPSRSIVCDAAPDVAARGDPDALRQALLSLLDNAIRYSEGVISVAVEAADGQVALSVRDDGPGIPPEVLPHIFERFYRGDGARAGPGMGLGLSIAQALIEAQGGSITAESELGQGSVFTITLPHAVGR